MRDLDSEVRELTFLNQMSRSLMATLDLDEILRLLMVETRDHFDAEAILVALLDEDEDQFTSWMQRGVSPEAVIQLKLPSESGIAAWVTGIGEPFLLRDRDEDCRFCREVDERTGFRTETLLAVPIATELGTIGAIEAINPAPDKLSEPDLTVLKRVADQAALAVHNARVHEQAQRGAALYESLFQNSPVPIVVMDLDTKVLRANLKAAEFMVQSPDALIGSYWCDWFGDDQAVCEAFFADPPENRTDTIEVTVPTPEGPRILRAHMTVIDYGGQRAIQWIGHDITESAELGRMRDDLIHMVVHDLQNPLNNIVGSLEIMERGLREHDKGVVMEDVLALGVRSCGRLERLVHSLLDLRQLEEGRADLDKAPVGPAVLGREAIDSVRPGIRRKDQELTIHISAGLPRVNVDRDMIARVLTNLLDNAAKFTQPGGKIAITIEQRGKSIAFSISDNGPGISPNAQDRAFERFTRLESTRRTKGTGLGLPFCKLAVEAHGGRIWVDSTPGEGSEFTFTLPLETD